jgi:hypothetical protein
MFMYYSGLAVFPTQPIFEPHSTKRDLQCYVDRMDHMICFSQGYYLSASGAEEVLGAGSGVLNVFARGRG